MLIPYDQLHPGCKLCLKQNVAKHDIIDPETKRVLYKKGSFPIKCDGIPADPESNLVQITDPSIVRAMGGEGAIREMARIQDPILWAQDNITIVNQETGDRGPWLPQGATRDNIERYHLDSTSAYYQELMVRCTARRSVYRIGRRCIPLTEPIVMSDGSIKAIGDIEVGDLVLSYNFITKKIEIKQVLEVFENGKQKIFQVNVEGRRRVTCTSNHPIYTVERGWLTIDDGLEVGFHVLTLTGNKKDVEQTLITSIKEDGEEDTRDISIEDNYNFFVDKILVHNSGKSHSLATKALHKMCTNESYKVIVIAPGLSHIDNIFDIINEYVEGSPSLKSSKRRFVRTPYRALELQNGSRIRGFVSGGETVRGQGSDMIIIDEAAYVGRTDLEAILFILTEHKNTILLASSTPTGAREQFYKWDMDETFKSFHYPSMCRPIWDVDMETEMRKENPGIKYRHEALAEHGEMGQGVFQHEFIDRALNAGDYEYKNSRYDPSWIYTIGVDWNPVHGTEIVVVGADSQLNPPKYTVVDMGQVFREGHTQMQAMREIIDLTRKWKPAAIYVDRGAGSVQVEFLEEIGSMKGQDEELKSLASIITPIDFGSKITISHPLTGEQRIDFAKPLVVENAVRMLEGDLIQLSRYDSILEQQLRGFIIAKIGSGGRPVYTTISEDVEDHRLDAFMLALFAFMKEFSRLGKPVFNSDVQIVETLRSLATDLNISEMPSPYQKHRPTSRTIDKQKGLDKMVESDREFGLLAPSEIKTGQYSPSYRPFSDQRQKNTSLSPGSNRSAIRRSNIR